MKKIILTIAFVTASLVCFAQGKKVSVVELQNGSVIRGVILESEEGTVKVQTADHSVFVYPESEVVKIAETNEAYRRSGLDSRGLQKDRLRGFIDLGFNWKIFGLWTSSIAVDGSIGYQVKEWLYAGGGAGIHFGMGSHMTIFAPIFADVRIDLLNYWLTPFVDARLGYEFEIMKETDYSYGGGLYFNPSFGFRFAISDKMGLNVSVGYDLRRFAASDDFYNAQHGVSLKLGVDF